MKKILSILLVLAMILSLAACTKKEETTPTEEQPVEEETYEGITIRIGGLKGPTSMGMVKLLDDNDKGLTENTYEFTMAAAADELTPLLIKGELDVLAVPANLGSVLYNKTEGAVKILAVNTLGVLYICEKGGETVNSIADLKGKTIFSTGKGATPEYTLDYLLQQNGLDPETDVTIEWKSEPTEVVAALANTDAGIAMLPQPFVTVAGNQLENFRIAISLTDAWDACNNGSQLITGILLVNSDFAENNPEGLAKFLEEYEASTTYVNENVEEAATLIENYDIVKAAIAKTALPYCNIVCITGNEMKTSLEGYFQVLYDQNPASVGGTLPAEDIYWINE